jgi:hypothetical protein
MLLGQSIQDMAVYEWGVILRTIGNVALEGAAGQTRPSPHHMEDSDRNVL